MNRQKYIHVKRKYNRHNYSGNSGKKPKHRPMCIEDYDNLPKHGPLRSKNYLSHEYHYDVTRIDFYRPLKNYLKDKVGECYDDIYSDLIKKTMPKYRHILDDTLDWFIEKVSYYEKEVPFRTTCNYSYNYPDRFIILNYHVDYDGLLQKFNSKEELFTYAKNKYRQKKLERILDEKINNDKFDDVVQFNDILTDNCGEIRFDSRIQWFYNRYNKNKHTNCV